MIDLTYPAGTFSEQDRRALAENLTSVLLRAERAPDTEFFRSITWVFANELPQSAVFAAGSPVDEPIFRVQVSVPEGALSERRKEELVAEATRVVLEAAGLKDEDGLRVWVLIRDVPEGNWGAAGNVVHFEQLRQIATQQGEQAGEAVTTPA
jgi:phenylpyruvate tautomerase PptA (4-oxalocrotonate tautomerase family)